MKLSTKVGLDPGHIVLEGTQLPQKGARPPQFSAQVWYGQTAGRIKMPHGTDVGLSQGDLVLDGDPVIPPPKGHSPPPIFSPYLLWPTGWKDQDATWYGGRPRPMLHCGRWGPQKGTAPQFSAYVYVMAKRLYGSRCHLVRRYSRIVLHMGYIQLK